MSNTCSHRERTALARATRAGGAPALLASPAAMADVQPLRALHYEPAVVGEIADVVAPPYDVIDDSQRAQLLERSPFNVVAVDLPRGAPGGRDMYETAAELFESWQLQGVLGARLGAGDLGAHPGVLRPRRRRAHAQRVLLPRAHRGLRPRPRAPARAHPSRPEGGPPASDQGHASQHLADLLAVLRPAGRGLDRARAGDSAAALGGRHRRRRHPPPALEGRRPAGDRGRAGGDGRRRAADRRRPPSLRDDAGLRRGGRRRGRPPLHPDVPRRARGPGPDRVSHPSPRERARPGAPGGAGRGAATRLRDRGGRARGAGAAADGRAADPAADGLHRLAPPAPAPPDAEGPVDRRCRPRRALRAIQAPRHRRARDA